MDNWSSDRKRFRHVVFMRNPPAAIVWGGLEKLLCDWFERIDHTSCKVTFCVEEGWGAVFREKLNARGITINVIEVPKDIKAKGNIVKFFRTYLLLRKLHPSCVVFMQGQLLCFELAQVLAGVLATFGQVYMHENLGPPDPDLKVSKYYFGFFRGIGLWWYTKKYSVLLRAHLSRKIVAVSYEIKERLISLWHYPANKLIVRYPGVDLNQYYPSPGVGFRMRQRLGFAASDIVVIVTARLSKEKCIHRVIEAFEVLSHEFPALRLVIAGSGPLDKNLRDLAVSKSCSGKIVFLGHVDNVSDYLKMSDIHVTASDNEGFGLSVVEALATGLLCVATKCPGPNEILQDGVIGFLVEKNIQGVVEGLRRALQLSPEDRQRMGLKTLKYVRENFEINDSIRKIFEVFRIPYLAKPSVVGTAAIRPVSISVIIATFNRCEVLGKILRNFFTNDVGACLDFELIVVDNNSTDATRMIVEADIPKWGGRLKYCFEPVQGKPFALNRGIKEARGEILAFTDDDVVVGPDWVRKIGECFSRTGCDGMGGRVLPVYPEATPKWVKESPHQAAGAVVIYDYGEGTCEFEPQGMDNFIGANYAFKRSVFEECGLFRTDLTFGWIALGEDLEFVERLLAKKKKLYYCGDALVWHPVDLKRLDLRFIARWHMALGRFAAREEMAKAQGQIVLWLGVPRYLIKGVVVDFLTLIPNMFYRKFFFQTWRSLFRKVGMIEEYRKIKKL